jgi:hypothetical protein
MITMKMLQETRRAMLRWLQLDEARISEALHPNLEARGSHGSPVPPPGFMLPSPGGDEITRANLRYCANQRLPEMTVDEFVSTSYMDELSTSECFSIPRRKAMRSQDNAGVNYELAPDLNIADAILAMRSWISHNDVPNVDDWQWGAATQNGEWVRVPCCQEVYLALRRAEGLGRRFVPTHHQVIPGITCQRGVIPESHPGWPDNYTNHGTGASMTPGAYTHTDLEKDHRWLGSWTDVLGDGNRFYFAYDTVVNPRGTSTDELEGSKGSIFYQEAAQMNALLIRRFPIITAVMGQTWICAGNRSGGMPPLLFAERCKLSPEQVERRAARPPATTAFHSSRKSAMGAGKEAARGILAFFKEKKISTVLGLPEPIRPIPDVVMGVSGGSDWRAGLGLQVLMSP